MTVTAYIRSRAGVYYVHAISDAGETEHRFLQIGAFARRVIALAHDADRVDVRLL